MEIISFTWSAIWNAYAKVAQNRLRRHLYLDVLRDLKRIHSRMCSVAYPVLEASGEMAAVQTAEGDSITLTMPGSNPMAH
jgi:hypothetical protein